MMRETYQSPQLTGRVSFPPETSTTFRPYIKDTLLRQERALEDEEDAYIDEGESDDLGDMDEASDFLDDSSDI